MISLLSGQGFRRVAVTPARGPEWHGPCPVCNGTDRFHVWPEQGQGGTWWCRGCDKGGDLIAFYRWRDGLGYREACARAGVEAQKYTPQRAAQGRRVDGGARGWAPAKAGQENGTWAAHAAKFVDLCASRLAGQGQVVEWLAGRGVDLQTAGRYRLGWNPKDAYRQRASWGLPPEVRADGREKRVWLPAGLVIPGVHGGQVGRVRIRRPEGEPRYWAVAGSDGELLVSRGDAEAYVVVESELDALAVDTAAGDLVGVIAMGTSHAKPTASAHSLLERALHISVSLDADPAGDKGASWWREQYRQAEVVRPEGGKDPGEMVERGADLRAWVVAGLPPRFQLRAARLRAAETAAAGPRPDEAPEAAAIPDGAQPDRSIIAADGRQVFLVDNKVDWQAQAAAGRLVCSRGK